MKNPKHRSLLLHKGMHAEETCGVRDGKAGCTTKKTTGFASYLWDFGYVMD
jgi:hypothetical protein